MPRPGVYCVTLIPPSGNGRVYEEISTTAWTIAANMAMEQHPGHTVETVYESLVTPVGKCVKCGEWQQVFAVVSRRLCRDCR